MIKDYLEQHIELKGDDDLRTETQTGLATRIPTLVDRFNPPALAGGCLVHLRIQLCPILERRVAEKARLIDLFEVAIKNNSAAVKNSAVVKISDLMKVPS